MLSMLIRSQDKQVLVPLDVIKIQQYATALDALSEYGEPDTGIRYIFVGNQLMGKYNSEDRAVEVVDAICRKYCKQDIANAYCVMQMPEE